MINQPLGKVDVRVPASVRSLILHCVAVHVCFAPLDSVASNYWVGRFIHFIWQGIICSHMALADRHQARFEVLCDLRRKGHGRPGYIRVWIPSAEEHFVIT
jgi:hypothetical protein